MKSLQSGYILLIDGVNGHDMNKGPQVVLAGYRLDLSVFRARLHSGTLIDYCLSNQC